MLDEDKRCQSIIRDGSRQCNEPSCPDSDYCIKHGGNKGTEAGEKKRLYKFKSEMYQERMRELIGSDMSKDLSGEIAILRVLIEERFNMIDPAVENDFLTHSAPIADLISRTEKLVTSCHKLEKAMGMHVDKSAILIFAGNIVQIISEEIQDETLITKIADRMTDAIKEVGQND